MSDISIHSKLFLKKTEDTVQKYKAVCKVSSQTGLCNKQPYLTSLLFTLSGSSQQLKNKAIPILLSHKPCMLYSHQVHSSKKS